MLEGYKAYILPAVAALLLLGFFLWRAMSDDAPAPEVTETKDAPRKSRKQQIEEAITAAGPTAPPLPDAYKDTVSAAMAPLLQRCRKPRPDDAARTVAVEATVKAADGVGGFIDTIELRSEGASDGFLACIREGTHGLQLPDGSATGKGSYRFELAP